MARLPLLSILAFVSVLCFASAGFALDSDLSRIIPAGTVFVHENGQVVGEYTMEAPFPEGKILSCKGKCAVKLDDAAFMAEDQSQFAIETKASSRYLTVNKGIIYFGITEMPRELVIITPEGVVTSHNLLLNASSSTKMLEGYVKVGKNTNELGIISGGSLQVSTHQGPQWIKSGERILLAQANMGGNDASGKQTGKTEGTGSEKKGADSWGNNIKISPTQAIAGGAIGAFTLGGVGNAIYQNTRSSSKDPSPSKP